MKELTTIVPHKQNYRPDIDGLRCIAVGSVILFHAMPGYAPAGFFGVDIFFVISGYLITSILLREARRGHLSIVEFYKRRIRRIFPALTLLLGTVLMVGWFTLVDARYAKLGLHSAAAAGFVANILFWQESSYFISSSDLLHLWSLGVEEQFYFVWPLIIYLITRQNLPLLATLLAITTLSLGYSLYATIYDPTAAFYSPISRFWQLSVGGIVAASQLEMKPRHREGLAIIGAVAIAAALLFANRNSLLPGLWAMLPVLGTASIIQAGPAAGVNRLLSLKPAVGIGLISYPLYLWHWPALQFVTSFTPFEGRDLYVRLAIVFSVVAAALTYWLVERPLRKRSPAALLLAMVGVFLASVAIHTSGGFPGRPIDQDGRAQFLADYARMAEESDPRAYRAECDFLQWHSLKPLSKIDESCTQRGLRSTQFLWGDSHGQALSPGLRSVLPVGSALAQVATSGCTPSITADDNWLSAKGPYARACSRSNAFALRSIERLKPEIVYLTQSGGHENTDWEAIGQQLLRRGAGRVILIGPVPQWQPSLAARVADHWPNLPNMTDGVDHAIFITDAALRQRRFQSLTYISVIRSICRGTLCTSRVGQSLLVVDYGHLSVQGSKYVAQRLFASPAKSENDPDEGTITPQAVGT